MLEIISAIALAMILGLSTADVTQGDSPEAAAQSQAQHVSTDTWTG